MADFQFDDYYAIVENPFIKHSNLDLLWKFNPTNFFTNVSFAINYQFSQLNVTSWHMVNVILHLLNSIWVYHFLLLIFKTPPLSDAVSDSQRSLLAIGSSLLFLLHPLQADTVIYLAQRGTLLVSFFCLLTILFYLKARLENNSFYFLLSLFCLCVCMFTHPSALSITFILFFLEFCFLRSGKKIELKTILIGFIFLLPLMVIPLLLLSEQTLSGGTEGPHFFQQFLSQIFVIPNSLIKLLFPFVINFPFSEKLLKNFFNFMALVIISIFYVYALFRFSKIKLVLFCLFWYLFCLMGYMVVARQSFILSDHWVYLAGFGFFTVFSYLILKVVKKTLLYGLLMGLILTFLFSLTYARALIWADSLVFLQEMAERYPKYSIVHNQLGLYYLKKGMLDAAEKEFNTAFELNPAETLAKNNIVEVYLKQNKLTEAQEILEELIKRYPDYEDPYINLANLYFSLKQEDKALENFQIAKELNPFKSAVHIGLGNVYYQRADFAKAKEEFTLALWLNPDSFVAHYNLGNIKFQEGNFYEAFRHYQKAIQIQPRSSEPLNNMGHIYFYFHDHQKAAQLYRKAILHSPHSPEGYYNLANALHELGEMEQSKRTIETALKLYEKQGREEIAKRIRQKMELLK